MSGVLAAVAILAGGFGGYLALMHDELKRKRDRRAWFEIEQDQRRRQKEVDESAKIGWRQG